MSEFPNPAMSTRSQPDDDLDEMAMPGTDLMEEPEDDNEASDPPPDFFWEDEDE